MTKKIKPNYVLAVKHNIEVAHRLITTKGKCENIHGHSMWVTLRIKGFADHRGMVEGLDFGTVKDIFRTYLDGKYDHRILLNEKDPFAGQLIPITNDITDLSDTGKQSAFFLPGLSTLEGDPTTENIAHRIGWDLIAGNNPHKCTLPVSEIEVWETSVNMATWKTSQ